ncbi:hypothetical protein OROMI_030879 [Orobanche minor]
MKSSAMFSMLCLAVLLALFTPSLGQQVQPKWCPAPPIPREGACDGSTGKQDCFFRALGHYSASQMPTNIRCVDLGKNQSQCTCYIVCA